MFSALVAALMPSTWYASTILLELQVYRSCWLGRLVGIVYISQLGLDAPSEYCLESAEL